MGSQLNIPLASRPKPLVALLHMAPTAPQTEASRKTRWFTAIPMQYREGEAFWGRDAGLFCLGFIANGVESRFVALGDPAVRKDRPLILCGLAQMEDPNWWKQWNLDGVVLYSWALPQYEPIARAIKGSGAKLILILDTDGLIIPQPWVSRFFHVKYTYARASGKLLPGLLSVCQTLVAASHSRHQGTLKHLQHADVLAIPSPLGVQRYARFLRHVNRPDLNARVALLHHPVASGMRYDPSVPKEPAIVSVGGWDRLVKGGKLLVQVLGEVLALRSDYRAFIVGPGEHALQPFLAKLPDPVRLRITLTGPLEHDRLVELYQRCRVSVNPSYSESFGIASAEALCCGCSVVGHALIASMIYFCSLASGTASSTRSRTNMADALLAELTTWESGERDPVHISRTWTEKLHVDKVAHAVLDLT